MNGFVPLQRVCSVSTPTESHQGLTKQELEHVHSVEQSVDGANIALYVKTIIMS